MEREPMFSKKNLRLLSSPLGSDNPISVKVLGICSALAVTVKLENAVVMTLAVIVVMACANVIISLLRNTVPNRIRVIVQLVVIAFLVIVVDQLLKAFIYEASKQLSIYVGLIITNCIIMGRLEAFALGNKPFPSLLDGIGNGMGYGFILIVVAFFRELLGRGQVWGYPLIKEIGLYDLGYQNSRLMVPMALFIAGIIIWVQRYINKSLQEER